jgi:uncharacterized HAD superfamily protein
MLAAVMLALDLNLPLTDIDSLAEGRLLQSGYRLSDDRLRTISSARRIAVVDDSVLTGREMRRARAKIEACGLGQKVVYVAVYGADEAVREVDTYFEICPMPRIFSWNLMHRSLLSNACVDIDGVLCVDPTAEENDDGPQYRRFLETARPLFRPSEEIGTIVTCRLEKYRARTERWLAEHSIRYRELVMWDLPDKQARLASGGHADFKAAVYRARSDSPLFIESSTVQAQRISDLTYKPVLSVESQRVHWPGTKALLTGLVSNPRWVRKLARRLSGHFHGQLLRANRPN